MPLKIRTQAIQCNKIVINEQWNTRNVLGTFWRLYINNRYGASLKFNDHNYDVSPGQIHLIPPWLLFSCHCEREVEHFYVHFDITALPSSIVKEVFARPYALPFDVLAHSLCDRIMDLDRQALEGDFLIDALSNYCFSLLLSQLAREHHGLLNRYVQGHHQFAHILDYVEGHLSESIGTADLAELAFLSEDHFAKKFKRTMNITPSQYISERRVALASQMLLHEQTSIDKIAEVCGFSNRFYLSRVFKKLTGMAPAECRRSHFSSS